MTANELRKKFLEFFKEKGHAIISGAPLVPQNDPTVLFTPAGMHPLVPYLLGEKHPEGKRIADVQKCVRTIDIDEVGDDVHLTFFEMLGNWSLGDPDAPDGVGAGYWKKEAIEWSLEFLTDKKWLGLDKNKIAVSVFAGDSDAPFDEESFNIWKNIGIPEKRIARLPKKNNWWGPAGEIGPCGPDTEMFVWSGEGEAPESFDSEDARWVEAWNDVFMEFNKTADGKYEKLIQKNVDTGMGLERVLTVINGLDDNYKTELFWPMIQRIGELSDKKYGESKETTRAMRIIADHIKAATFILGDGKQLTPSNVGAGYVLRRLIRRAVRNGFSLGIKKIFTSKIAEEVIKIYSEVYSELAKNRDFIISQLDKEEKKAEKEVVISAKGHSTTQILRKVISAYINCHTDIYVEGDLKKRIELTNLVCENLIGIDVVSSTDKKMHFREDAKLALKLIEKNKSEFNEIELIGTNVDNSIVDFAEKNKEDIIATLDREIKNKVRNKKLIIRGKKKLEIV